MIILLPNEIKAHIGSSFLVQEKLKILCLFKLKS